MRQVGAKDQFTPLGLWFREYCRDSSEGLCITNLDYIVEDFRTKKIQLIEEKQSGGHLHRGQKLTFDVIDRLLEWHAQNLGYEYWGFFVLQLPRGKTMVGPGMTLNGNPVSVEQLQQHINFEAKHCDGLILPWRERVSARGAA